MTDEKKNTEEEMVSYEELKEDRLFDVCYDVVDYCRENNKMLLKYGIINDIIDLFKDYINFPNPFILKEDDLISSDDEYDELN